MAIHYNDIVKIISKIKMKKNTDKTTCAHESNLECIFIFYRARVSTFTTIYNIITPINNNKCTGA